MLNSSYKYPIFQTFARENFFKMALVDEQSEKQNRSLVIHQQTFIHMSFCY